MKKFLALVMSVLMLTLLFTACGKADDSSANEDSAYTLSETETNFVKINVKDYGSIVVELYPETAPITVANFKKLVSEKFYDGLIFHRVIETFMIQGGGITQQYMQKECDTIKGEFSANGVTNDLLHTRGVISMARTTVMDSASSQFFIMHQDAPHLDGQYAAFGMTVEGLEVVDKIAAVETDYYDMPLENVVIESIRFVEPK